MPTIIWLKGTVCGGCTSSLVKNLIYTDTEGYSNDLTDYLDGYLNPAYGRTMVSADNDGPLFHLNSAQMKKQFILVVEGGIPTVYDGMICTVKTEADTSISLKAAVRELASVAKGVICVGSCASFGGIVGASPNPTRIKTVRDLSGIGTLNISGCPPHPDWIAGTLAMVLADRVPDLDQWGRPLVYYSQTVHDNCPRKAQYESGRFAEDLSQEQGCMFSMGCQGPFTHADCPSRGLKNNMNYCLQGNSICIGCTESDFPKERRR